MAKLRPPDDLSKVQTFGPPAALPPAEGYWIESRGPLASLLFVAPLLLLYEAGVLLAGPGTLHNAPELWLRGLLNAVGLGQYFLLPALMVGGLLAWQYFSGQPWRVRRAVLLGMCVESLAWAVALWGLGRLQARLLAAGTGEGLFERLLLSVGAGFYEETLFRLLLLPITAAALQSCRIPREKSFWLAALGTSLVFSAMHYIGPHGDTLALSSFVFRLMAGLFFAGLFVYRGFGIVVGAHAMYDVLVSFRLL
ncbi:MAG: CPBP family intramembrane glutamic endopeptidase [Pirellulales bacterium]